MAESMGRAPFWPALRELTLARMREFLREPEAVFWVFAFPVIMTCALGIAFRTRVDEPVLVGIERATSSRRRRGRRPTPRPGPQWTGRRRRPRTHCGAPADSRCGRWRGAAWNARCATAWCKSWSRRARCRPTASIPARAESRLARLAVDAALQRAAGRADAFEPRQDAVRAVGSRYIDWLVPGLLGMNIMGTGMWSTSFAIVTARTRKLLKRLVATPMPRSAYLLSLVGSRLVFLVGEATVLVAFGWIAFDVAVHGSIAALTVVSLLGALAFGGIALLVSSRAQTIEGVSGMLNLVMVPMWVFSGVFFSSANFPETLQPFVQALPLTALNDALRAVMNDGEPLAAIWRELAVLTVWGGASFALALKLFRWT